MTENHCNVRNADTTQPLSGGGYVQCLSSDHIRPCRCYVTVEEAERMEWERKEKRNECSVDA